MPSLIYYPDSRLRTTCALITKIDAHIDELAHAMNETMIAHDGIGLAAPQIGSMLRLIVIREKGTNAFSMYINPVITYYSKKKTSTEEGCLSIPDLFGFVERSAKIRIGYQTLRGEKKQEKASGMRAIVLQHETDHVNGILILDRNIHITKEPVGGLPAPDKQHE